MFIFFPYTFIQTVILVINLGSMISGCDITGSRTISHGQYLPWTNPPSSKIFLNNLYNGGSKRIIWGSWPQTNNKKMSNIDIK